MKEQVLKIMKQAVAEKQTPGVVVQVMKDDEVIFQEAVGNRIDFKQEQEPMAFDTIFDLASLTKVVATLPAALKLIDEGVLALNDPVSYYIPEFAQQGKQDIRLLHLLTHTAGLKAFYNFFEDDLTKEDIYQQIYQDKLYYEMNTKVVYSDLGFMLLSRIIEVATGQPFNDYVQQNIFAPLEMNHTAFNPKFPVERYAATEFSEKLNTYKLGVVHDENTESVGGISGHAGLFSTIADLGNYTSMIQNNGLYKGNKILSASGIQLSQQNFTPFADDYRGLGWQLKRSSFTTCGDYFSDKAYGHTGFTGTSIWFDPEINLNVIILTNRVHYGRDAEIMRLRARVHNIVRQSFHK